MELENLPTIDNSRLQKFQSFNSLAPGQYWKAKAEISEQKITAGEILLVENIKYVENRMHTIILRAHPRKVKMGVVGYKFLFGDFLELFEYEPNGEKIREEELAEMQREIQAIQENMMQTQSDPKKWKAMIAEAIAQESAKENNNELVVVPAAQMIDEQNLQVKNLMLNTSSIATIKGQLEYQQKIVKIQNEWIQSNTQKISAIVGIMSPFFEEKAAAILARTNDVRDHIEKLKKSLQTLDLYVGKQVEVEKIKSGKSAAPEVPLMIVQEKLIMTEELSVFIDISERFDFQSESLFFETLEKYPEFVSQIFPSTRCVLIMATTRHDIDYGNVWANMSMNEENRKVFLLIRDGGNIYRVFSPIGSHLKSYHLFPTTAEMDGHFKGYDGSEITLEDLNYVDHLDKFEAAVLHYRRFLILLCGLDHREKIFGDFYPEAEAFEFLSLSFQEKYFKFLANDDASQQIGSYQEIPSVEEFVIEQNDFLTSGSRVLCLWNNLWNKNSASGAFNSSGYAELNPENKHDILIAQGSAGKFKVKILASGHYADFRRYNETKSVNITVTLDPKQSRFDLEFLCLDNLEPEDLEVYIFNRRHRIHHVYYIRAFKAAWQYLQDDRVAQATVIEALTEAALIANPEIGAQACQRAVNATIRAWRAANRGIRVPGWDDCSEKIQNELLKELLINTESLNSDSLVQKIEDYLKAQNEEILKIASKKGKIFAFSALPLELQDDRLFKSPFVRRREFKVGKDGNLSSTDPLIVTISARDAGYSSIKEYPALQEWSDLPIFGVNSLLKKAAVFDLVSQPLPKEAFGQIDNPKKAYEEINKYAAFRDKINESRRYVLEPKKFFVIGLILRDGELYYLTLTEGAIIYLKSAIPEHQELKSVYVKGYNQKGAAASRFNDYEKPHFRINLLSLNKTDEKEGLISSEHLGHIPSYRGAKDWRYLLAELDDSGKVFLNPEIAAMKIIAGKSG